MCRSETARLNQALNWPFTDARRHDQACDRPYSPAASSRATGSGSRRTGRRLQLAADLDGKRQIGAGAQSQLPAGLVLGQDRRRGSEVQHRPPDDVVEPPVRQDHPIRGYRWRQVMPAGPAMLAADLEDIREVGPELQPQAEAHPLAPVVSDSQLLVAGALPQELLDGQMQRPQRDAHATAVEKVRVGHVGLEPVVLVVNRGAEEERSLTVQLEQRAGQKARALVIDSLFAQPAGHGIAVAIENRERVTMLQDAGLGLGQAGSRQQGMRIGNRHRSSNWTYPLFSSNWTGPLFQAIVAAWAAIK